MASSASNTYARNLSALLLSMVSEGALTIDLNDEIQQGVVITHDGAVHDGAAIGLRWHVGLITRRTQKHVLLLWGGRLSRQSI